MQKWYHGWLRYPRTQQERREAGDKRNPYVRAKRRAVSLPTAYEDIFVHKQKSWKSRRKTRYHVKTKPFAWRSRKFNGWKWGDRCCYRLIRQLENMGLYCYISTEDSWFDERGYSQYTVVVHWYGPDVFKSNDIIYVKFD